MKQWEMMRRLNAFHGYRPNDLVGVGELANDIFHVRGTVITTWNARRIVVFPPPIKVMRMGPVFSLSEYVVAWNEWIPQKGNKAGTLDDLTLLELNKWLTRIRESEHGI